MSVASHGRRIRYAGVVLLTLLAVVVAIGAASGAVSAADEAEPNDDRANATNISSGDQIEGTVADDGDEDWFAFEAERGDTVNATLDVGSGGADTIVLTDGDSKLDSETGENSTVSVGTTVREDDILYLKITRNTFANNGTDYTLTLDTSTDDEFEPNEDRGNATRITTGTTQEGTISIDDADWYEFDAQRGETINLTVEGGTGGENTIRLYDDERKVSSVTVGDSTGSAGTTVQESGTYYVEIVRNNFANSGTDYTLDLQTYETDGFEPNENRGNATRLVPNATRTGTISLGDADWFRFDADAGETINVTVDAGPGGTNGFEVYDSDGNSLGSAGASNESVSIGGTVTNGGTHYLELVTSNFGSTGTDYTVDVDTYATDSFEPNEDADNASALYENPFTTTPARISIGDVDWFEHRLSEGETVTVTMTIPEGQPTKALKIIPPVESEEGLKTSANAEDDNVFEYTAKNDGIYHFRVYEGSFSDDGPYEIEFDVGGELLGPPNDRLETDNPPLGNNDRDNASRARNVFYPDLGMVDNDEDYFRVELSSSERLVVNTSFDHSANDLALELLDSDGETIRTVDSSSDDESLVFDPDLPARYYLKVSGESDAQSTYSLRTRVLGSVDVSLDPERAELTPGEETTADVVLEETTHGVGGYDLAVSTADADVLTLVDGATADGNGTVSVSDNSVEFGVDSLTVDDSADDGIVVGNVTVRAGATGDVSLDTSVDAVLTDEGLAYPIRDEGTANLTVRDSVVDGEADGDGDYATIQTGLDNASDGDRLEVRPGVYRESLTVDSDVTLVAPQGATLSATGSSVEESVAGIELTDGAAPTIDGLTVSNFDVGIDATDAGGDWVVRNATIEQSTVESVSALRTSGAWEIHQSSLLDNGRHAINATGASVEGDATENWFGEDGPGDEDCVGNVNCGDALDSRPATSTPSSPTPEPQTPTPQTPTATPTTPEESPTTADQSTPESQPTPTPGDAPTPTPGDSVTVSDGDDEQVTTADESGGDSSGDSGPGFGVGAVIAALAASLLLARRRA